MHPTKITTPKPPAMLKAGRARRCIKGVVEIRAEVGKRKKPWLRQECHVLSVDDTQKIRSEREEQICHRVPTLRRRGFRATSIQNQAFSRRAVSIVGRCSFAGPRVRPSEDESGGETLG
jgi:hypothetical protein